jgi:hypothetical protein
MPGRCPALWGGPAGRRARSGRLRPRPGPSWSACMAGAGLLHAPCTRRPCAGRCAAAAGTSAPQGGSVRMPGRCPALWGGPAGRRARSGRLRPRPGPSGSACMAGAGLLHAPCTRRPCAGRCAAAAGTSAPQGGSVRMPGRCPALWGGPAGRRARSGRLRPRPGPSGSACMAGAGLLHAPCTRRPCAGRCAAAAGTSAPQGGSVRMPGRCPALWGGPAGRRARSGRLRPRPGPSWSACMAGAGLLHAPCTRRPCAGRCAAAAGTSAPQGGSVRMPGRCPALWGGPAGRRARSGRLRPRPGPSWSACMAGAGLLHAHARAAHAPGRCAAAAGRICGLARRAIGAMLALP